ncbi:hypothetical protein AEQU2_02002 [Aequorivita lipolytica]|nr:hypothetical protein AEQU2_02002 [Aequorivita lipolytica]
MKFLATLRLGEKNCAQSREDAKFLFLLNSKLIDSNPYQKMLLRLFFSEKNHSPLKGVYA